MPWPGITASDFESSVGQQSAFTGSDPNSDMVDMMASVAAQDLDLNPDALSFDHIESFNVLVAGESGLGKSTFLRNLFAHLDPTKQHQMKRRLAAARKELSEAEAAVKRNEQASRDMKENDTRSRTLRKILVTLKDDARKASEKVVAAHEELIEARRSLECLQKEKEVIVAELKQVRTRREAEEDDDTADQLGEEAEALAKKRDQKNEEIMAELHKTNLDNEKAVDKRSKQTSKIEARLIEGLPLLARGKRQALDVTLIDTPGYGDVVVDTPSNGVADKVVAEVVGRISTHLAKSRATLGKGLSLDDERKYWNDLVHLCLFFVPPHRMKRADITLMRPPSESRTRNLLIPRALLNR